MRLVRSEDRERVRMIRSEERSRKRVPQGRRGTVEPLQMSLETSLRKRPVGWKFYSRVTGEWEETKRRIFNRNVL